MTKCIARNAEHTKMVADKMGDIVHIEDHTPHDVFEAMCWACGKRWIAVMPTGTNLKDLECPGCNTQGYAFMTGQEIVKDGAEWEN